MKSPVVDADLCTGCGACADACPAVFEIGDNEVAAVKDPAGAGESEIQDAMDNCPSEAISWSA